MKSIPCHLPMTDLQKSFFSARQPSCNLGEEAESRLRDFCWRARAGTMAVALSDEDFVAHVGGFAQLESLAELHASDLLTAFAALRQESSAVAQVAKRIEEQARAASQKLGGNSNVADEVHQVLSERLLVGDDARIASYAGLGPLDAWLRVAATRTALSMLRKGHKELPIESAFSESPAASGDLEIEYLKAKYAQEFRAAFRDSMAVLDDRQRNLLRMYYLDGVGLEELGQIYQVHGSSISRWMARARELAFNRSRELLRERVQISDEEIAEIVALVQSQLDLSVSTLLRDS